MTLADANVLIAAFRSDHAHHRVCSDWLGDIVRSGKRFAVAPLALLALVRVCTHPKVYARPSSLREALDFCATLLDQSTAVQLVPGHDHWPTFARLCLDLNIAGSQTTDAWFAALAIEHDCEWVSLDRGFARYPNLRWRQP
jgi:toxin-antitoxin system PIN domain toxin